MASSLSPPQVLVLTGFVLSVLWISAVANELVSLLNAIGLMLNISPVILGLTILAWGNSLGDIVADVSLAIQGYFIKINYISNKPNRISF